MNIIKDPHSAVGVIVARRYSPLTPMHRQLMERFYQSNSHTLTKQEICDTLWPRKVDPSETLYTLIKRLKQTLTDNGCQLQITSDRGRAYQLGVRN